MLILKNCKYVVTQNVARDVLENVDIAVKDDVIVEIGHGLTGDTEIDCSNKIVMPGLINTHTHIGMHSLRGVCDDEELHAWLDKVVAKEKGFTPADIQQNAEKACEEMLLSGTTTFVEMYAPVDPVIAGVKKYGIRAILCPVVYDFLGNVGAQLTKAKQLIDSFTHPLITLGFGAHSIYACDEKTLVAIKEYAKTKNLLTPIHVAETRKERFDCFDKHKKLPVEYLENIGFLDNKTLLVHSIWITKGEVRVAARNNVAISHCPVSNMKLSSGGVMPLMEMFDEKVIVGLGTDSVASNNNMDMFKEMMICGLLHKQHRWDPKVAPVQKLLDLATVDAAAALG